MFRNSKQTLCLCLLLTLGRSLFFRNLFELETAVVAGALLENYNSLGLYPKSSLAPCIVRDNMRGTSCVVLFPELSLH